MAMTLDHNNNRHLGSMGFDHMSYGNGPQFTNPFASGGGHLFGPGLGPNHVPFDSLPKRAPSASLSYPSAAASSPSLNSPYQGSSFPGTDMMGMSHDGLSHSRSPYEQPATSLSSYIPTSAPYVPSFPSIGQTSQEESRRLSHS